MSHRCRDGADPIWMEIWDRPRPQRFCFGSISGLEISVAYMYVYPVFVGIALRHNKSLYERVVSVSVYFWFSSGITDIKLKALPFILRELVA